MNTIEIFLCAYLNRVLGRRRIKIDLTFYIIECHICHVRDPLLRSVKFLFISSVRCGQDVRILNFFLFIVLERNMYRNCDLFFFFFCTFVSHLFTRFRTLLCKKAKRTLLWYDVCLVCTGRLRKQMFMKCALVNRSLFTFYLFYQFLFIWSLKACQTWKEQIILGSAICLDSVYLKTGTT